MDNNKQDRKLIIGNEVTLRATSNGVFLVDARSGWTISMTTDVCRRLAADMERFAKLSIMLRGREESSGEGDAAEDGQKSDDEDLDDFIERMNTIAQDFYTPMIGPSLPAENFPIMLNMN